MTQCLAFHSYKGGTGKTTIASNLAAILALKGFIASARWLRKQNPKKVVIALPVAPRQIIEVLQREADEVHFIRTPKKFNSVSDFYIDYDPVPDERIAQLLKSWEETSDK